MNYNWIGLDFGSQKGDTTAIAFCYDDKIRFFQSSRKEETDSWIQHWIDTHPGIKSVFIDAPLSLPSAYFGVGNDYMYRIADRQVRGMSPMFLGGLTARAIRLKSHLETEGIQLLETYPAQLEKILFESKSPKSKVWDETRIEVLKADIEVDILPPQNRHQYDALLAWYSGWRYNKGVVEIFGDKEEGLIYV